MVINIEAHPSMSFFLHLVHHKLVEIQHVITLCFKQRSLRDKLYFIDQTTAFPAICDEYCTVLEQADT